MYKKLNYEIHIGNLIRDKLEEDGRKVEWLAKKIHCNRDNIYKMFDRKFIDTAKLLMISVVLKVNFPAYFSELYCNTKNEKNSINDKCCVILQDEMHIGKLIKKKLEDDGRKVVWLANKIHCNRRNIYDIFDRSSIDTELLLRISLVLNTNFFAYLSEYYQNMMNVLDTTF